MRSLIHKEGWKIISIIAISLVALNILSLLFINTLFLQSAIFLISLLFILFVIRFFRIPNRVQVHEKDTVYSAADGKVVVIEEVFENEYFNSRCIQISVFMSVWNIHINWSPVKGLVKYYKYHPGKYLIATHPKSSDLNERNTIVIQTDNNIEILARQIAGFVARRIVSYVHPDKQLNQSTEIGFIKFGSRVDIFLPLNTEILVKVGDRVLGSNSKLALLK
ncbi:MAG: phosphatidylserine decarboxylase family protein [Bacteroidales bacterium]|nr:phosphatidylserine decarboxylase family protein [Bacteroidales bacterium]